MTCPKCNKEKDEVVDKFFSLIFVTLLVSIGPLLIIISHPFRPDHDPRLFVFISYVFVWFVF